MFIPLKSLDSLAPDGSMLRARAWDGEAKDFVYPEREAGIVRSSEPTGVAFSGGGNRAMVAAWGQLRALVESGLIDKVDYISAVSGGSWASTAFTYYSDGASNDEEFLGRTTAPSRIRVAELERIAPHSLGAAATESFMSRLVEQGLEVAIGRITANEVWLRAVGSTFFERFGVYDPSRPAYISYDEKTVADIVRRNPALQGAAFSTVRNKTGDAKRPYLVVNSTLMWPNADNMAHFEYTPLAAGSKRRLTFYNPPGDTSGQSQVVGGGFLETFAFSGGAPAVWPPQDGLVRVPAPSQPFSLAFASGTSSAAFAATNASLVGANALLNQYILQGPPVAQYWPWSDHSPEAQTFTFGDGGSLENFGVIPLLLRGVKRMVVFVNAERRLSMDYDPGEKAPWTQPSIQELDGNLSTLFGILPSDRQQPPTPNNQVFRTEDFRGVVRALQAAQRAGGPAIVRTRLEVQPNDWWGLDGGWNADICWVYLERVDEFDSKLAPEVTQLVEAGRSAARNEKTPYWGFPNYRTMFQGGKMEILAMSPGEANLLADFTSWVAQSSSRANLIRRTLGG
ncbi:MAG: patatin-like phospholipase family protein [Acidobacteria bacterium]|nr:patatin-like phospholipase family protein [Acidobacteriota bacterium]